jgi:hypothetical protein
MALKYADRVKETSTTTGTGTLTLGGAMTGFQSFAAIGDGNQCVYCIDGGAEWEVGVGTYTSSGTTLSRTTVIASSNAGALVNFSAGAKTVHVTKSARNLDSGADSCVTAYEVDWSAKSSVTFSNGNTLTHDGYVWNAAISGTGGVSIVNGSGLRFDSGTAECFLWADFNTSGNNGISLLQYCLGRSRLLRAPFGIWTRAHSYNLPTSGGWYYACGPVGVSYNYSYTATRRSRNAYGTANNATGGFSAWSAQLGRDQGVGLMPGNISLADSPPDTVHNGTDDVVLMYYRDLYTIDYYYGNWSSGWPTMESMTFGGRFDPHGVNYYTPESTRRYRDPGKWRQGAGGSGSNTGSQWHIVSRTRITYWDP